MGNAHMSSLNANMHTMLNIVIAPSENQALITKCLGITSNQRY